MALELLKTKLKRLGVCQFEAASFFVPCFLTTILQLTGIQAVTDFTINKDLASPVQSTAIWLKGREVGIQLKATLHTHALLITLIVAWLAVCMFAAKVFDRADRISLSLYTNGQGLLLILSLIAFLCGHAIYTMVFVRPEHLTKCILNDLRNNYLNIERITVGLPILLFMPMFISAWTSFKTMIPFINPYSWDFEFAKWDAIIHGGVHPWLLLRPIIGKPLITSVISFFYNLWFFVLYAVLIWQAFSMRDSRLRMQFFLTFICSWALLGNVVAMLFSSVGPCYYGRYTGLIDPFQPLMDYLWLARDSFPVWSLHIQEMLWETYEKGGIGFGSGISAMPSMHVSMAFLFTLIGWRTGHALGVAFTVYAVPIMIGSVHLGWHYAIDGYAAIIGTWLIWRAVGWLMNGRGSFLVGIDGINKQQRSNLEEMR